MVFPQKITVVSPNQKDSISVNETIILPENPGKAKLNLIIMVYNDKLYTGNLYQFTISAHRILWI
jgi:hypothetical protein